MDTMTAVALLRWAARMGTTPEHITELVDTRVAEAAGESARPYAWPLLTRTRDAVHTQLPETAGDDFHTRIQPTGSTTDDGYWASIPAKVPGLAERIDTAARAYLASAPEDDIRRVVAAHRAEVAAADEQIARDTARDRQRRLLEAEADEVRERGEAADRFERGTQMLAGAVIIAARSTAGDNQTPAADLKHLAGRMGLSRPSVYKYAKQTVESGPEVAGLSNAELAQMHLGYGPGQDEAVDNEFWGRFPILEGWWRCAHWLRREDDDAWRAQRTDEELWTQLPPRRPEYQKMNAQYLAMVRRIAGGPLADGEEPARDPEE